MSNLTTKTTTTRNIWILGWDDGDEPTYIGTADSESEALAMAVEQYGDESGDATVQTAPWGTEEAYVVTGICTY